jgi:hypothetical protein
LQDINRAVAAQRLPFYPKNAMVSWEKSAVVTVPRARNVFRVRIRRNCSRSTASLLIRF